MFNSKLGNIMVPVMAKIIEQRAEFPDYDQAYLDFIVKLKKTASGGAAAQPTPASTANQKTSDALARILRRGS